ncbi:MAG: cytochrome c biogenesis protein ResB [Acidobacteria bacterium]|nr:cytochrome c biogenesis protein ResB [Acidobacteriota bacterium]
MATTETEVTSDAQSVSAPVVVTTRPVKKNESIIDKVLKLLSSVRFGLVMLSLLLVCSLVGMLIVQVEIEEFPQYFAKLTPAQRLIYTKLDLFNIYHSWYFTLLLAITALNIILASIDRFPTAWQYIVNPKLKASPNFVRAQNFTREIEVSDKPVEYASRVAAVWKKFGYKAKISEENNRITVFAQRNAWNRLGAYFVHVALLTIFVGGFLTNKYGVGGNMEIVPGESANSFITQEITLEGPKTAQVKLPFTIECTDLQQKLIRPEGGLEATNTIDWLSYVRINDKEKNVTKDAIVHLNNPYDYRGYRLFQSKFTAFGYARSIEIRLEPLNGGPAIKVTKIPRNGAVDVEGIGRIAYTKFFPDFQITQAGPESVSSDYNNPAAQLEVTAADGTRRIAFAFNNRLADELLKGDEKSEEKKLLYLNGYKVILGDFEKAAMGHTLTLQYDPGRVPAYLGFTLLFLSLCSVFFFSHQRVWAVVESGDTGAKVSFGGHTNRNRPAFEGRFNSMVEAATVGGKHE